MKIPIEEYEKIGFNEDYIRYSKDQMNGIKANLEKLITDYNQFKKQINNFLKNFENCFPDILIEVNCCLDWLKYTKNYNAKKAENIKKNKIYIKNISEKFEKCNTFIYNINQNDYMKKIKELNKKLRKTIKNIFDLQFYPPECGGFIGGNNSILSNIFKENPSLSISKNELGDPNNYYDDNNKESKDFHDNFSYLQNEDGNNMLSNIDQREDKIFSLSNDYNINNNIITKKIILEEKSEDEEDNEDNTNQNYLKCSICKAHKALYKCYFHCRRLFCEECRDYILKYDQMSHHTLYNIPENELERETQINLAIKNFINFLRCYIIKFNDILNLNDSNIELPFIRDIDNFESQIDYLQKINKIDKLCENKINNEKENNNKEINGELIIALENIFKKKKIHINDNINDIDDGFLNEKCKIDDEFEEIKNSLFYFINIVTKDKEWLIEDKYDEIKDKISEGLNIDKNNIFLLINDKPNNFVKSKELYELKHNEIHFENPVLNKLYEIKLLTDNLLCKECKIPKKYLDYRGNTLNPNSSFNIVRGTEIYDPPYGYIGIGLNVLGKYDNGNDDWLNNNFGEWAIAYHNISSKLSSDKIKKILNDIITNNGLIKGISNFRKESHDKRHWGKVGEGIYLTPSIKNAEKYTGIISFNNKKYKVILMAKVYIKGIREPEYTNFWVLNKENIRIYRILFKEIS